MKEAAKKLADKAFNELGIDRIEFDIANCNEPSIRIAEGVGAKRERDMKVYGARDNKGYAKGYDGKRYILDKPRL